jgi:type VI protein secretion system component Hcp
MADDIQVPIMLELKGVDGELGKLPLEQAGFSSSRPVNFQKTKGMAIAPGMANVSDVNTTSVMGAHSPVAWIFCLTGKILDEGKITTFNGATKLHSVELTKVGISGWSITVHEGHAMETLTLCTKKYKIEHEKIGDDGTSQGTTTAEFDNDKPREAAKKAG